MLTTSYHNHTRWSDGEPTVEQMVAAARRLGLTELGISDHFAITPDGAPVEWSMPPERLDEYVADVKRAAERASDLTVRVGIEADFYPETADRVKAILSVRPLDYIIGSVHFMDGFPIDEAASWWDALTPGEVDRKWRLYWGLIRQMAAAGFCDFVGHLDLPKKFGHRPAADMVAETGIALDAIAAADMAVEINTAGWSLKAHEAYPSLALLRAARERSVPLVINADAHLPAHLTRDFDRAAALAREAGYTEVVRYEARRRRAVRL